MKVDTKKLLELCEKATPGPWMEWPDPEGHHLGQDAEAMGIEWGEAAYICGLLDHQERYPVGEGWRDFEFIAACDPETVKSLCAELDRARELLSRAERCIAGDWNSPELCKEIRAFLTGQDDKRGGV